MGDWIRNLLLLAIAGAFATLVGSAAAYWRDEERRLRRMLRRALEAPPEMAVIAHGYGMAAGLNLDRGRIAVLWDAGEHGLVYRLDQLVGGELVVDDRVAARAFRGEPRKALDDLSAEARRVLLRLVFDNPRDPDFELVLWPHADPARVQTGTALEAVRAARRWVSGIEAILRKTAPAAATAAPVVPPNHRQAQETVKQRVQRQLPLEEDDADDEPPWEEADEDR
jgi:hypothetical protein